MGRHQFTASAAALAGVGAVACLAAPTTASATEATGEPAQSPGAVAAYRYVELPALGGAGGYSEAAATNGAGVVVGTSNGHAVRWSGRGVTDLGDGLPGPLGESSAHAVNLAGVVAGQSHVDETNPPHAVIWTDGVMTDLGTGAGPGSGSSARGVNDDGTVVGIRYTSQSAPVRATLWRQGRVVDLGSLGGTTTDAYGTISEANAVNDAGQVVGAALPPSGYPLRGFLWQAGVMRDLGTLGGTGEATSASAINASGVVVGFSQTRSGETHGFRWRDGVMRDLGVLGADFTYRSSTATGVNTAGVVVGSARVKGRAYGHSVATIWRGGVLTDLNTLVALPAGRRLSLAFGIDDRGAVVARSCEIARCETDGSSDRAVVLRPLR